jgi:hypothetical protein
MRFAVRGERLFVCSVGQLLYLRRRDTGPAAQWWREVERHASGAPGIVRELLRGESVACDPTEAEQALAWARAHPTWVDEPAPLYAHDPNA